MQLQTRRPPGHAKRKLLGYLDEIARLRAEGHSIAAIHEALLDAGVEVGWGAVRREVARLSMPPTGTGGGAPARAAEAQASPPTSETQVPAVLPPLAPPAQSQPSHCPPVDEISAPVPIVKMSSADDFFERFDFNPLSREKAKS